VAPTNAPCRSQLPAASLGAEDIDDLTIEQHRDSVTAFLAGVLQAATDYLTAPGSDPAHDGFGYRQVACGPTTRNSRR
jgi:hypothetical protein